MSEVVTNELPDNWVQGQIKDLVSIRNGYAFKSKDFKDDTGVPVIRQTNLSTRIVNFNKPKYLPNKFLEEFEDYTINKDDVLIGLSGSIGNLSRYLEQEPALQNQRTGLLVEHVSGSIKYIEYYLQLIKKDLLNAAKGVAVQNISSKAIENWSVPIAPPEQQKRIIAKIEELFSHIDAGIEALNKAKQRLKQYRQSVLKAAVTGELTKEWREENKDKLDPASQLLERILKQRRQKWEQQQLEQFKAKGKIPKDDKWKEKYKEPLTPEFEHVGEVPDIPSSWEWVTVNQLTSFVKDGPHYSPKYAEKGIPFITGGNVRQNGVDFDNCKYITEELHEELTKRCKPELNDILYTKGGTTGIARVNTYDFEFNVWVHVAVLRLVSTDCIEPFYMQHALNSLLCYAQSQKYTHGVGNQDLGLTRMIKICLALPPMDEQREIIEIINNKMDSINRIEEQVEHMLIMGDKNKQSVLASAFSGKLLEQYVQPKNQGRIRVSAEA